MSTAGASGDACRTRTIAVPGSADWLGLAAEGGALASCAATGAAVRARSDAENKRAEPRIDETSSDCVSRDVVPDRSAPLESASVWVGRGRSWPRTCALHPHRRTVFVHGAGHNV